MAKTEQIPPIRVEPELRDELQAIADQSLAPLSAHVRQAIVEYVARMKGGVEEAAMRNGHESYSAEKARA